MLAQRYGVKKGTVENILYRRSWQHLNLPKAMPRRRGPSPDPSKARSRHRKK
jgi:hypothetical protein